MGRRAFTLVELIITIAVIAVLAVTAFLVITKWISKSRDSSRLQDIAVIQQGLETEIVNTKTYPMPDNYTGIYDTGNALAWYQGEFTDNVKGQITTLNKTPKDPQGRSYGYSLSNDKKQYQLRAFLENTSYNDNYIDTASAATQVSKINGNYNGFLVTRQSYSTGNVYSLWNIPTLFLWSGTVFSSGINYVNENNKPIDNTTNIKFADVSGLYDADGANNTSTLDGIVSVFSGTNGVSSQSLASLTMKTAAGGVNSSNGSQNAQPLPQTLNTKLLLHFDDNVNDSSITNKNGITNNGATYVAGKFGKAISFNIGNTITVPNSDDWNLGTSDFTMDFWAYPNITSNGGDVFAIVSRGQIGNYWTPWFLYFQAGAIFMLGTSSGSSWDINRSSTTVSPGQRYHFAVVRNGNNFYFFKNGTLVDNWTSTINFQAYSTPLIFGNWINTSGISYGYNGYLDEFRLVKGYAQRTSNFTPPTNSY